MKIIFLILLISIAFSYNQQQPEKEDVNSNHKQTSSISVHNKPDFVKDIETAHRYADYQNAKNVRFDIKLFFSESERLNATITTNTSSSKAIIEKKDGSKMIFTGDKSFIYPDSALYDNARFDMFTWIYFFALPYKLSDPGTKWSEFDGVHKINDIVYNAQKLTFESNVGDSPDDWYIVYADPKTNLITYAAYIVTLSKSVEQAEEDPHSIEYSNYKVIDGIPIAHTWNFWGWNVKSGITKKLGFAEITNVEFPKMDDSYYNVLQNAVEIP